MQNESFDSTETIQNMLVKSPTQDLNNNLNKQSTKNVKLQQYRDKHCKKTRPNTLSRTTQMMSMPENLIDLKNQKNDNSKYKIGRKPVFLTKRSSISKSMNFTINLTTIPSVIPKMSPKFLKCSLKSSKMVKSKAKEETPTQKLIRKLGGNPSFCELSNAPDFTSMTSIMKHSQKNQLNSFNNSKRCIIGSALKREMLHYNLREDAGYGLYEVKETESSKINKCTHQGLGQPSGLIGIDLNSKTMDLRLNKNTSKPSYRAGNKLELKSKDEKFRSSYADELEVSPVKMTDSMEFFGLYKKQSLII